MPEALSHLFQPSLQLHFINEGADLSQDRPASSDEILGTSHARHFPK
jgi:hypothetical protein